MCAHHEGLFFNDRSFSAGAVKRNFLALENFAKGRRDRPMLACFRLRSENLTSRDCLFS